MRNTYINLNFHFGAKNNLSVGVVVIRILRITSERLFALVSKPVASAVIGKIGKIKAECELERAVWVWSVGRK